ncbi:hypothetical protein GM3708_868 [Geminocystis sp. NIES-3708]|uniref:hypothetical protein n=1 Tax=Geminocystis sp. NIES-3708 TaxID=1615909 RepID=UPI0005FC9917|nr:hypothetical protein [Geminocystis sp. NIES-3708]BAQ60462.1 hypothetical protein GM3708_868 [Geminocystis sp. NIES-3708]
MSKNNLINQPIGKILEEAGLINSGQIHVALVEQSIYSHLKLGEILALHGWIDQQTADFFGHKIKELIVNDHKKQIGNYFFEAGLLKENDIKAILDEQKKLGVKFGSLAVLRGCITQDTLKFFLKYFASDAKNTNDIQYRDKTTMNLKRTIASENSAKITHPTNSQKQTVNNNNDLTIYERITINSYEELEAEGLEDIIWKG